MKIRYALKIAAGTLARAGIEGAEEEAEYLLAHVLGCKRHDLFLSADKDLASGEAARFMEFIARRARMEPPQYITGSTEFMGLTIRVTPATLIPRPETELLVEEVLRLAGEGMHKPEVAGAKEGGTVIIDLCTGSGCIAVALARKLPGSLVYATDVSEKALEVAAYNAEANGVKDQLNFRAGDLYGAVEGFDLKGRAAFIVSNPPYVTDGDFNSLPPEIRAHEPEGALRAGADGLDFIRRIVQGAPEYLAPGGRLVMEIGYGQAQEVEALTRASGVFSGIKFKKDLAGIERILVAGLPSNVPEGEAP